MAPTELAVEPASIDGDRCRQLTETEQEAAEIFR